MTSRSRTLGSLAYRARHFVLPRRVLLPGQDILGAETLGAVALFAAAVAALCWANSPWSDRYLAMKHALVTVDLAVVSISQDLEHWINDGLMAVFFFVVGLELKRELVHGELADVRRAALPAAAAVGGMIVPAVLFLSFNPAGAAARGWGIPMATDIAFALGVLAFLGRRMPPEARVFLLALATIDDLGAIAVIALFYTDALSLPALGAAAALAGGVVVMREAGVRQVAAYAVAGVALWVAVLHSGVHATIAGVVLGLLTPARSYGDPRAFTTLAEDLLARLRAAVRDGDAERVDWILGELEEATLATESPLERLERLLQPWSRYVVLPVFALANSGLVLSTDAVSGTVSGNAFRGVLVGLLLGKLLGCLAFAWLAVRMGLGTLPRGVGWRHMAGIALLAGIGFTVSLFITGLAYRDPDLVTQAKLAILAASTLAGITGWAYLRSLTVPAPSR